MALSHCLSRWTALPTRTPPPSMENRTWSELPIASPGAGGLRVQCCWALLACPSTCSSSSLLLHVFRSSSPLKANRRHFSSSSRCLLRADVPNWTGRPWLQAWSSDGPRGAARRDGANVHGGAQIFDGASHETYAPSQCAAQFGCGAPWDVTLTAAPEYPLPQRCLHHRCVHRHLCCGVFRRRFSL